MISRSNIESEKLLINVIIWKNIICKGVQRETLNAN